MCVKSLKGVNVYSLNEFGVSDWLQVHILTYTTDPKSLKNHKRYEMCCMNIKVYIYIYQIFDNCYLIKMNGNRIKVYWLLQIGATFVIYFLLKKSDWNGMLSSSRSRSVYLPRRAFRWMFFPGEVRPPSKQSECPGSMTRTCLASPHNLVISRRAGRSERGGNRSSRTSARWEANTFKRFWIFWRLFRQIKCIFVTDLRGNFAVFSQYLFQLCPSHLFLFMSHERQRHFLQILWYNSLDSNYEKKFEDIIWFHTVSLNRSVGRRRKPTRWRLKRRKSDRRNRCWTWEWTFKVWSFSGRL